MAGVWRTIAGVVGGLSGATLGVGACLAIAWIDGDLLASAAALAIAAPGAHLASWILGWPLAHEAAIACYAIGLLGEAALAGALAGAALGVLASSGRPD